MTAEAPPTFHAYQKVLDQRIKAIESRRRRPEKGDDILLSVIMHGRHAAIDPRLVVPSLPNDPLSKLNIMIDRVEEIFRRTTANTYYAHENVPYAIRGAAQFIFSDFGTPNAGALRGFSVYRWIRQELIRRGIPAGDIAFIHDYRKTSQKQALFSDINAERIKILSIGLSRDLRQRAIQADFVLHRAIQQHIAVPDEPTPLGMIARLESALEKFEAEQADQQNRRDAAERRLADYEPRIGEPFEFETGLVERRASTRSWRRISRHSRMENHPRQSRTPSAPSSEPSVSSSNFPGEAASAIRTRRASPTQMNLRLGKGGANDPTSHRTRLKKLQQKYEPQTAVPDAALPADTVGKAGTQADLFS